ncbi:MAG: hypothetical protein ACJ77Z_06605 [Thermoleophilaceae bacterium]
MDSRISVVTLAGTVLATVALGLTGPPASAHRIDLAAARMLADYHTGDDYTGISGCSRLTDHRVSCYSEYEDTDLDSWTEHADLVVVGSRLYWCDVKRPCTKREKPATVASCFVGHRPDGRAEVDVEMAARGAGATSCRSRSPAGSVTVR